MFGVFDSIGLRGRSGLLTITIAFVVVWNLPLQLGILFLKLGFITLDANLESSVSF